MAIVKQLFAVSPTPSVQAELTTQAAILAAIRRAGSFNIGANVRLHWFDPEAASAWLDFCRSDRFSRATINALPSTEQNARVVELWDAFGRYWRCLNVSPYGWARFRKLCERLWGYPSYADGQDGWNGKPNVPFMQGRWGGAWRQRSKAAVYNPTGTPRGSYSPAYDRGSSVSARFFTSEGNQDFGVNDVVFGTQEPYAIENAGNRPGQRGVLPDHSFAPTVEVHRVWMQRTGKIEGGYIRALDRKYADENTASTSEVGPAPLSTLWRAFNFSEPPANNPGRWDDWTVGFVLPDAAAGVQGGTAARHRRASSTDVLWTVPPLVWYWEMLGAASPLPTGYGDGDTYPNLPREVTPTISVLDYLASKTPEYIVREVMNDVMWRNRAMAEKNGVAEAGLASAAAQRELDNIREASVPSLATSIVSAIATIAGGVVSLAAGPAAGKAALASAGAVSTAAGLIDKLDNEYEAIEMRRTDVFGRLMPALDTVGVVDDETGARVLITEADLPSSGGSTMVFVNLGANADALGVGPLSIVGMPHGGTVEVGSARTEPRCSWTDDTMTTWRCTIPTGPTWVRVESATGEARIGRAETSSIAPATLTWDRMFAEHRYAIAGLPQGTAVFVDGAPAMGTWSDAAMTEWHVFMPTGNHAVRLVPPGGEPVLASVVATGAMSRATWAGLQTIAIQQRQTADTGSNAGTYLAVGVGILAAGLFAATVMMDGPKKQRNPKRR